MDSDGRQRLGVESNRAFRNLRRAVNSGRTLKGKRAIWGGRGDVRAGIGDR
jgi:hypothetical protein